MHDMLGVACAVFTITNSSSDYICATRAQGMASHFSFHNIRDDFEPKGVAEHWIQKINHAHGTFNRSMGRGYGLLGGSTSPTTEHSGEKWDAREGHRQWVGTREVRCADRHSSELGFFKNHFGLF